MPFNLGACLFLFELTVAITTLSGASGSDHTTLVGTELADSFAVDADKTKIEGLAGNDTVTAASAITDLIVETGSDADRVTLSAEALSTSIDLGLGADTITVNDFTGSIYGGGSNDTITLATNRVITNSLVRGDGGADEINLKTITGTIVNSNSDDDTINVTISTASSSIYGGRQRDTITVAKATDSLIRGDANEDQITLTGNISGTIINGNAADDTIEIRSATATNSTVYGGGGDDDIDGTAAADALYITGNKGDDTIDVASAKNHTIYGGAGDDNIDTANSVTKAALIYGGDGNDSITLGVAATNATHTISGGEGKDTITGSDGKENIDGGTGDDNLVNGGGDGTIYGRAGADTIDLELSGTTSGTMLVYAGADDDIIRVDSSELTFEDTISGDTGTDTLLFTAQDSTLDMTAATAVAKTAFDNITNIEKIAYGADGDAYTMNTANSHTFSAKAQTAGITTFDAKYAAGDSLTINASAYTSSTGVTMIGADAANAAVAFTGGKGNDSLSSGAASTASSSLTGGDGNDTFTIDATIATTKVLDLSGNDVLILNSVAHSVTATVTADYVATSATKNNKSLATGIINANNGVDVDMSAATGTFGFKITGGSLNAATLKGSAQDDSITGGAGADSLVGNSGDDIFIPKTGNDTISGGAGDDVITLLHQQMTADDSVEGGTGTNRFDLDNGNSAFDGTFDFDRIKDTSTLKFLDAGTGANSVITLAAVGRSTDLVITVDGTNMTAANSTLTVTNQTNKQQTDVSLIGGGGKDTLAGALGDDTIIGGALSDSMTSGSGSDVFHYSAAGQSMVSTSSTDAEVSENLADVLVDFTPGTDKISFAKIGASSSSLSFGTSGGAALNISYASGKVHAFNFTGTALDGSGAASAAAADAKGGVIVYNPTASAIDMSNANNTVASSLEAQGAGGLEVIFLKHQANIDYTDIVAGDFIFA